MLEFDWEWVERNTSMILNLLGEHLLLSYIPTALALIVALPLGILCARLHWVYIPTLAVSTIIFAIPSIALFTLMLPLTGLTRTTAIVPLMLYTVSMLIRNVVDGLHNVDGTVRQAAEALGYRPVHRLLTVELPIALPVVMSGLRVAMVATIGAVAVTSILGLPSLGSLFIDGTQRFFLTPIVVGIILTIAVAVISDLLLIALQRIATPWTKGAAK